jgi:hypothetical protein
MKLLMDIFTSFSIIAQAAIELIAKTVASVLVNCQQTTVSNVYVYAVSKLLSNIVCEIFMISLLNKILYIVLNESAANNYALSDHAVQGGAV